MIVFRVKNLRTGLYSTGGYHPHWSKNGKLWTSKGALKNHFNLANGESYHPPHDFAVVGYHLVDVPNQIEPIQVFLKK